MSVTGLSDEDGWGQTRHLMQPQHKKPTFAQKSCMAEEVCMNEVCGSGYEHNANKFPYTAEYWKTALEQATAFTFKVCAKWCGESDSNCQPLKTFAIRLDSELVRNAHFIQSVRPGGRLQDSCDEVGIGYRWEGAALGALNNHPPSHGEVCEHFEMIVRHDPHQSGPFWLTDICQQNVDVSVNKNGKIMMAQSTSVAAQDKFTDVGSCLIHFQALPGQWGFTLMPDIEFSSKEFRPTEYEPTEINNAQHVDTDRRKLLSLELPVPSSRG
ncbi:hypothetical protein WJX84_007815 [Apatococcus fuscideae]|uniref:Uncharacterized protein n=1 Tax=Apatococcus fuscideae TaxID=2026836 RepID=A0AAW1TL98_9CHLO